MTESFAEFFGRVTGSRPHGWQAALADEAVCTNRLIRIPTGFGKTLGVLLAWAYHRALRAEPSWPRRLVWCLPMRVLVEQTYGEACRIFDQIGVRWDERSPHDGRVGVHVLMGGADAGEWHLWPEHDAVLIGTQDMLLSRALNRGYAAARARWPIDFGLLNADTLWVMDEVQLMDVGLATSAQLQAFRDLRPCTRPSKTWWMSATLQPQWLRSRDTAAIVDALPCTSIPEAQRTGHLWDDVRKPLEVVPEPKQLAGAVAQWHADAGHGQHGPTLVVVNTVKRAVELARALIKAAKGVELRLVHSRFRPRERAGWREAFLNREQSGPGANRIIVATQVIEAGVDVSAGVLVTDIAPWTSLVQRFGRAARWGGHSRVVVLDTKPKDDKAAAPYEIDAIEGARWALGKLSDVSPRSLETFEGGIDGDARARLYPYSASTLLLEHEINELFDTTADLTGADLDISRFVRATDDRDLHVFWDAVPEKAPPPSTSRPSRDALCAVPFLAAREWLCKQQNKLVRPRSAWVWDWLVGEWREAKARDLYPGQTVLVDAALGGYDWNATKGFGMGFSPDSDAPVEVVTPPVLTAAEQADGMLDDDSLSEASLYRTIATHGAETGALARSLAARVGAGAYSDLLELAGVWHDVGKAHPAFQNSIDAHDRPTRRDLAKAPKLAWPRRELYTLDGAPRRAGFRHELASALRLFAVLQQRDPGHAALLGPWRELLEALGDAGALAQEGQRDDVTTWERAILTLGPDEFDLVVYLVASHHGKVRLALHATPSDQRTAQSSGRLTIRGLQSGDELPSVAVGAEAEMLVEQPLDLAPAAMGISPRTGASWSDRALGLLRRLGPFELAWLEALLRASDARASQITTADPLLAEGAI